MLYSFLVVFVTDVVRVRQRPWIPIGEKEEKGEGTGQKKGVGVGRRKGKVGNESGERGLGRREDVESE